MKKCRGCGVILQDQDVKGIGYVRSLEQVYCQRCFRLTHYGDTTMLNGNYVNNEATIEIFRKYKDEVFALIIDVFELFCLEQDDLMDIFKNYKTILIVNKTDLLPRNISENRIDRILDKRLMDLSKRYPKLLTAVITHYKDPSFLDLFHELLDEYKLKTIVFAGRSNAGKSTLINKIIGNDIMTTSLYPSTTLRDNLIEHEGYTFIDTPGLVDNDNYSSYVDEKTFKRMMILKTIKPKVFQFDSDQSYFYEGMLRIDVKPENRGSITFFINNDIDIHRCRSDRADDYYNKHFNDFMLKSDKLVKHHYKIDESSLFIIKGLGMIKINGNVNADIHIHEKVKIYLSQEKI